MTIWERTKAALVGLGLPLAANVLVLPSGESWPDMYIVYQLIVGNGAAYADDAEVCREMLVQVTVYSRSGLISLPDVKGAMQAAGFTPGDERELPYSPSTKHYGWAMDFNYLENAA